MRLVEVYTDSNIYINKKKAKTHQPGFVAETNLDPSPGEVTRTALFTLQEADGTTF